MAKTFLNLPHGLEVLIIKASVDPAFKSLLLDRRAGAAGEIGFELTPTEAAMLAAIPPATLEATIAQTEVLPATRRVFLGKVAAAMLAALGVGAVQGCRNVEAVKATNAVSPQGDPEKLAAMRRIAELEAYIKQHEETQGIRPDRPNYDKVYFDDNQATLREDQLYNLDKLVEYFTQRGELTIEIVGHTDERGSAAYNLALGRRRAEAVRDYFLKHGIAAGRMAIVSVVESRPDEERHDKAAWAKSRFVQVQKKVD